MEKQRRKRESKLRITQDIAIEKMNRLHNGFYSYEKTVYTGATDKMTVTCPLHGDFLITYSNHTHKPHAKGCAACGFIKTSSSKIIPAKEFISEATGVHGSLYDYSKVEYKTRASKVEIICREHGSFSQTPEKHLTGQGCPVCAKRAPMTAGRFTETMTIVHEGKYSYELITDEHFASENTSRKVPITCKVHGVFEQHFGNHVQGQGCRKCATFGYKTEKPSWLYIITCGDITKVGITNKSAVSRAKQVSKSYGREFAVDRAYEYSCGKECLDTETQVLNTLASKYKPVSAKFNGSTECFLDVSLPWLYDRIEMLGVEYA